MALETLQHFLAPPGTPFSCCLSVILSTARALLACWTPGCFSIILSMGLCHWGSFLLGCSSLDHLLGLRFPYFQSLLECHLLSEAFPDHWYKMTRIS